MSSRTTVQNIFVAGATGLLGTSVAYALLEAGAQVTALIQPGTDMCLNVTSSRLRRVEADPWNRGSLTGRSRGHSAVIHLIGSVRQQPDRGQTFHYLNVDSAQNITRMAIGDGVPLLIFISVAGVPWLPAEYINSKREAEQYIQRSGARWLIVRAPVVYPRGHLKNPLLMLFSVLASLPLLGRPFARWAPLPVDVMARGIAQLAIQPPEAGKTIYGGTLRRLSRDYVANMVLRPSDSPQAARRRSTPEDNDIPFGWLP